jgi:antitoxin component YwqK of YwqJK toxin-antitoxin module
MKGSLFLRIISVVTRFVIPSIAFICLSSCNGRNGKLERRKIGAYTVEAIYIGDSMANCTAKYFDQDKLVSTCEYVNGVKHGVGLNYYFNGSIADSLHYKYGKLDGVSISFDKSGQKRLKKFYFNEIEVGEKTFYKNGKIEEYTFSDFNKNFLAQCMYDSNGKVKEMNFSNAPNYLEDIVDNRRVISLILYFPNPPKLSVTYKLGLTNEKHETRDEIFLNSNRLILDTILSYPDKGWHYFIGVKIQNADSTINKVIMQDMEVTK